MAQSDVVNLADKLRNEVGRLEPNPLGLGEARTVQASGEKGKISTIIFPTVWVTCQSQASQLSAYDPNHDDKVHNYVLLKHNVRFAPAYGASISEYAFAVRGIFGNGALGDPIPDLRNNGDRFEEVFSTSIAPRCVLLSSSPNQTQKLEGHAKTTGWNFGGNVGFFGKDTGTGGIHVGYSLSETLSWHIPSVSCTDSSTADRVLKVFHMNSDDQKLAPFEIVLNEIFQLPAEDYSAGNNMRFEVGFTATSVNTDKTTNKTTNITYANVTRQIFQVTPPPPPPSIA
ncbi:hypothetical protein NM208_g3611 [Fusarium decemcellulare]|uniref:Uncharacterized protein n=1 Tax=Fusarium decemcellulare TaxID=57161 RepID=A0ACC1SNK0_9HYPO|nr:hypothetical protein NM208_g3611 [Fusarium decemcellulare]